MTTITQTITTLPTAPNPATQTPSQFSSTAAAYVLAQKDMVPQLNTWAGQANTVAGEVNANAIAADADAAIAEAAKNAAIAIAGAELWVSGQSYSLGDASISPINLKTYRANTTTSGTTDPSASAAWTSTAFLPGLVLLSTITASASATVDVETTFDGTYDHYIVVLDGVLPETNATQLRVLLKIDGTYKVADYGSVTGYPNSVTADTFPSTAAASSGFIRITGNGNGVTNASYGGINLTMDIPIPASTTKHKGLYWSGSAIAGTANSFWQEIVIGSARYTGGTQALTGIRFYFSSGNIASGTFRLYGMGKD